MARAAYTLLQAGNYTQAVDTALTAASGAWWKILLYLATVIIVFVTTNEEAPTAGVAILGAAFLSFHLGTAVPIYIHGVIFLIAALGLTMTIFRWLGKGE